MTSCGHTSANAFGAGFASSSSASACVRVQEVDYSCDCWVSALLRDPIGARVEAIDFYDGACVGRDASCELCGDLSIDCY